jgi:hypothetical protein
VHANIPHSTVSDDGMRRKLDSLLAVLDAENLRNCGVYTLWELLSWSTGSGWSG